MQNTFKNLSEKHGVSDDFVESALEQSEVLASLVREQDDGWIDSVCTFLRVPPEGVVLREKFFC